MQLDWPQEASILSTVIERILNRGSFVYPLFHSYIICVDILEELIYLWAEHGHAISLDLVANPGVLQSTYNDALFNTSIEHIGRSCKKKMILDRRITTRGADKGVREEIKQIMRRQAARDGIDSLDELLQKFIVNEQDAILSTLIIQ